MTNYISICVYVFLASISYCECGNISHYIYCSIFAEAWRSLQFHLKRNHGIIVRRINGRVELVQTGDGEDIRHNPAYAALEQQLNQMHNAITMAENVGTRYSPETAFHTPRSLSAMDEHIYHGGSSAGSDYGSSSLQSAAVTMPTQPTRHMSFDTATGPLSTGTAFSASIIPFAGNTSVDVLPLWQSDTDPYTVQLQRYQQFLQIQQSKRRSMPSVAESFQSDISHSAPIGTSATASNLPQQQQQSSQSNRFIPSMSMPSLPTSTMGGTYGTREQLVSGLQGPSSLSALTSATAATSLSGGGGGLNMAHSLQMFNMGTQMTSTIPIQSQRPSSSSHLSGSECAPPPSQSLYMQFAGTNLMEADLEEIMRSIHTP